MKSVGLQPKNIWMLTREFGDLAGAGGVKDVAEQLSRSLAAWTGRRISVVLPLYGFIEPEQYGFSPLMVSGTEEKMRFEVDMNYVDEERRESLGVWTARKNRVFIYLLDSPRFREKGDIYTYTKDEEEGDPERRHGEGHFDYFAMNLLLQKGAIQLILNLGECPDIIHCHDGHTSVIPAIIRETPWLKSYFQRTGFLMTIHNAGLGYHQEVNDIPYAHAMTGLPMRTVLQSRLRDSFDPLVCGGLYGMVNTVSENYARELQHTDSDRQTGWLGHHLHDLGITIEGITNGVDPEQFNPLHGKRNGLADSFSVSTEREDIQGKRSCKNSLINELGQGQSTGLERHGYLDGKSELPLFTFIGRLTEQKGIDILLDAAAALLPRADFRLIILGRGPEFMERQIIELVNRDECLGKICFLAGYDTTYAWKVYSGGDFFLVPSRYEPCGLTDFIAQLFGNIPIVHHVGGLVKVVDGKTGFAFSGLAPDALQDTMMRAVELFQDKDSLAAMQVAAVERIKTKYTWKEVKKQYLDLYKEAMERNAIY